MTTRIEKAAAAIFETLENGSKILSHSDLQKTLGENRETWRLPQSQGLSKFINFLVEHGKLRAYQLDFPQRPILRYTWGEVELIEIVQSISKFGYFTHFTAMQHHDLTEQISKTIFFNIEQNLTGGGTVPTQLGIDRAFKGKCRVSNNTVTRDGRLIRLLNGRKTDELGVESVPAKNKTPIRVTNLERTLIDISVRPIYSGGVYQVAQAFAAAAEKVDVQRIADYLRRLNYTYPFHQAIGYYMDRTGKYSESQLAYLRQFEARFDFYLDYGIKQTDFVKSWRLNVPKGF